MDRKTTQMIKGIAILLMITHHFCSVDFFPHLNSYLIEFGIACKICVAIYAVLSGYGYFFTKEKTLKYSLKKIWGLLKVYWISLFTLFIPIALFKGWEITPWKLIIQLFGLIPNLNWYAWYVFFYIFCMLVMPVLCKYRVFRFKPFINLVLILVLPYIIEVFLHEIPYYETSTIIQDLFSCFLYFPCFLIGYWFANNQIIEKFKKINLMKNSIICIVGIITIFVMRVIVASIAGFLLDVFYAPVIICLLVNLFDNINICSILKLFENLGKQSTGMWFFHAVFFSTYICDFFQPLLTLVSWTPIMFVWLVLLSYIGAFVYEKILEVFCRIPNFIKWRF